METVSSRSTPSLKIEANRVRVIGSWVIGHYSELSQGLVPLAIDAQDSLMQLDVSDLSALDTAGAALLIDQLGISAFRRLLPEATALSAEREALLLAVLEAMDQEAPKPAPPARWTDKVARLGETMINGWQQFVMLLGFMGLTLSTLVAVLFIPKRWRITALVAQIQQCGLNAVPIVALLTFLVGAVVAFLGATVLENFGATIYTVDLVAYSFLREFGVLLSAILLAGRTASAFTAQLGAMKVNEELDALRTQGLDPMELLVLPRMLALVITLPLLTFIGMLSGLFGGALVCLLALDISFTQYLSILQQVPVHHGH